MAAAILKDWDLKDTFLTNIQKKTRFLATVAAAILKDWDLKDTILTNIHKKLDFLRLWQPPF